MKECSGRNAYGYIFELIIPIDGISIRDYLKAITKDGIDCIYQGVIKKYCIA